MTRKEIENMQKEYIVFDDLSAKNAQLLKGNRHLCEENKDLKQNLETHNTNLKRVKNELFLVRESLSRDPWKPTK